MSRLIPMCVLMLVFHPTMLPTLANSHRIEGLVSLCSIPKSIVTHHLTDPTSRLISIQ